jgi:hypothetical protein
VGGKEGRREGRREGGKEGRGGWGPEMMREKEGSGEGEGGHAFKRKVGARPKMERADQNERG